MRNIVFIFIFLLSILSGSAQIGYQVSLLNNATGEARANERVKVTVKITDSDGNIVCEENKNETSNDFGVVSMSVGDSDTFSNADWTKLPFFIEASVDGRLIGKSQLLSVPVAEYAKKTGILTKDLLCSKNWIHDGKYDKDILIFKNDNTVEATSFEKDYDNYDISTGVYTIDGNIISIIFDSGSGEFYHYNEVYDCLINDGYIWK